MSNGNGGTKYKKKNNGNGNGKKPHVFIPEIIFPREEKAKAGRPSLFLRDPEFYCSAIIASMAEGMAKETASIMMLKINPKTFWEWIKKGKEFVSEDGDIIPNQIYDPSYTPFTEAVELGEVYRQIWWEETGRRNLCNPNFNYTGWMMQMTNLFRKKFDVLRSEGWARRTEETVEHKGTIVKEHKFKVDMGKLNKDEAEDLQKLIHKATPIAQ